MKKKRKIIIGVGVFILILTIILLFGLNILQTQFPAGTYIQAPTFYYYECNAASQPVESVHTNLVTGSSDGWILCPTNTDQCDLWITQTETPKWFATDRRIVYQICHNNGANCDPQVKTTGNSFFSKNGVPSVHIPNLLTTDRVWIDYQAQNLLFTWNDKANGASWYQTYKPFILWKVDKFGGGKQEYNTIEQGCNFNSAETSTLINGVTNLDKQLNTQTTTSNNNVPFYKTRNFIGTYVPISTSNVNFVTYSGQTGYCLNRQVFAISTVTTNGGTYQIVDSNFNTLIAQSVTCCPGEKEPTRTCNSQFQWVNIEQAECSSFKPCAGADWQVSGSKTLKRFNCVSGKCVSETKKVECTLNSDCTNNQECDSLLNECVDVLPGPVCLTNQVIVDGKCVDITPGTCKWYQNEKPASTIENCGFLGLRKILGNCKTVTTNSSCKTSGVVYFTIGGVILALSGLIFIKMKKKKSKSTKYGKLGK